MDHGLCLMFRKKAIQDVDTLDKHYFMYIINYLFLKKEAFSNL